MKISKKSSAEYPQILRLQLFLACIFHEGVQYRL